MGMFSARGKHLLFADADGATTFKDIERLEDKLEGKSLAGSGDAGGEANVEAKMLLICVLSVKAGIGSYDMELRGKAGINDIEL